MLISHISAFQFQTIHGQCSTSSSKTYYDLGKDTQQWATICVIKQKGIYYQRLPFLDKMYNVSGI